MLTKDDLATMARTVAPVMREHVTRATADLLLRVVTLEAEGRELRAQLERLRGTLDGGVSSGHVS
jgi:hypothetical protein